MAKARVPVPPAPPGLVRVHFTGDCIYRGMPMAAGDEPYVEPHEADSIELFKVGYRMDTPTPGVITDGE